MTLLSTRTLHNEGAKNKNDANEAAKHKNNVNETAKQENNGKWDC